LWNAFFILFFYSFLVFILFAGFFLLFSSLISFMLFICSFPHCVTKALCACSYANQRQTTVSLVAELRMTEGRGFPLAASGSKQFREPSGVGPPLFVSATNRRWLLTKHGIGCSALLRHRHAIIIIYLFYARLMTSVRRKV